MPTVASHPVGATGLGLMGFTWRPNPPPEAQIFAAMRTALSIGSNFWNGGEIYGSLDGPNSLTLLRSYFSKYPEDAAKVVICIKGGTTKDMQPDGTPEGVRRSVEHCIEQLGGTKKLDIFECARVDDKVPIETTVGALAELVREGKLGAISLSEVNANTIRRAAKVHPIAMVEMELSLWETSTLTNGVAAACAELGIVLVAYSPLGRGFLTGQVRSRADLPEGDVRRHFPRFSEENFPKNLDLVENLTKVAEKKGCTPGQLALAWVRGLNKKPGMPTIIPIPGTTAEERVKENSKEVELTEDEEKEIDSILKSATVVGTRYPAVYMSMVER